MFLPFLVVLTALVMEVQSEPTKAELPLNTLDISESVMYIRVQRIPIGPGMFAEIADTLAVFEDFEDAE